MLSKIKSPLLTSLGVVFALFSISWPNGGSCLYAQETRYELGRRLKRFEQQWQVADPQSRFRSTPFMEKAVSSFFSLQLPEAAKSLDLATTALHQTAAPDANTAWVMSRRIDAVPLMSDTSHTELALTLQPFYQLNLENNIRDKPIEVRFVIYPLAPRGGYTLAIDHQQAPLYQSDSISTQALEQGWTWKDLRLPEGDYMVVATAVINGNETDLTRFVISRIDQLQSRLGAIDKASDTLRKSGTKSSGGATMISHRSLLKNLKDGLVQETDYPASRLLLDTEVLMNANGDSSSLLNEQFIGDTWLTLAKDQRTANIRLRVPPKRSESYPILFLFHGAGGSENMFFETYGAGRAVQLAADRGWIVVAPRQRLLGGIGLSSTEILEELTKYFRVDRDRVFFMGHSMGAMQATQQAVDAAELPAAVVALGGGGRIGSREPGPASWFVAAGDRDFGKSGAKNLVSQLSAKGKSVAWKEYPQIEHMVIVQASLDDVFVFLDSVATKR
jgi:predicted esterase